MQELFFTVKITQILLKQAKYLLFQFLKKVDLIVSSVIHERCTRRNKNILYFSIFKSMLVCYTLQVTCIKNRDRWSYRDVMCWDHIHVKNKM